MRCPDCNKFVGIELAEPEIESLEISSDGTIELSVRLVKTCAECGTELEEASVTEEHTVEHEHLDSLEVEEDSVDNADRSEGSGRYARTFYGADVVVKVTCTEEDCPFEENVTIHVEQQASGFDSLV